MKNIAPQLAWPHQRKHILTLVMGVVLIIATGCQTCRLSEEDFQKQQRGETVDKETGKAVATVGTLGYYGYMLGECLAAAFRK